MSAEHGADAASLEAGASSRSTWQGRRLWQACRILISVGLLAWLVFEIDVRSSLALLADARFELLVLALGLMVLARYVSAYRWYILLRGKNPAVSLRRIARLVLTSAFLGYFLPGMGTEVLRLYALSRTTTDPALVFTSLLVERLVALFVLVVFVLGALAFAPLPLPDVIGTVTALGLVGLVLGALTLMHPRARALGRHLLGPPWLAPVRTRLEKLYRCLDAYRDRPGLILWSLALGVVFQLLRVAPVAIVAVAFGLDVAFVHFLVIVPITLLVVMMPISIGGLGVREASFVYLLGLVGVSAEAAFGLSIVTYLLHLLSVTPGAWIYARRGIQP